MYLLARQLLPLKTIKGVKLSTTLRKMATSAPVKKEWLVIIPDNANMLQKRLEVRP